MSKLLLTHIFYPILTAIAVWVAGVTPASANPIGGDTTGTTAGNAATTIAPTNALANASTEATTEQVERATAALDVKPEDWAYQTLQGLQTKYRCTDKLTGDRVLSREEFATSINTCVRSMEELVARKRGKKMKKRRVVPAPAVITPTPEIAPPAPEPVVPVAPPEPLVPEVSKQDLEQIEQLVRSYSVELQALNTRLQALDTKVTTISDQRFSTTTKLTGEAIFAITGLAGGPNNATRNTIFSDRVRLNFNSSFFGKDLLLVRLQSRNSNSFGGAVATSAARTNEARLGFEGSEENTTDLQRLQYKLPLSSQTQVIFAAVGSELNDDYYNFNPELAPAGQGSFTRFGRVSSIYRLNNEGASIGIDQKFSPNLGLVVSYAVPRAGANNPTIGPINPPETVNNPNTGLFGGANTIFSQIRFKPSNGVNLGVAYARTYTPGGTFVSGNNGSNFANNPFNGAPTSADHYGLLASVDLSNSLILSGWGGYTQAQRQATGGGSADIWEYSLTLAAKDFGSKGSTLGFVVGMQPRIASNTVNFATPRVDPSTGLHLETYYKYKVSDNISITPGLLILTNPEHNAGNPTEYLGTIRTTFTF
jgi:hypothetical protein